LLLKEALERRAKELSQEEADLADRRIRFETERIVAFYDELSTAKVHQFLACVKINVEPLSLVWKRNSLYNPIIHQTWRRVYAPPW
jgi:hypothetical protein